MRVYYVDNRTAKIIGMPLHNALVTLCQYDNGANGAMYYSYDTYMYSLCVANKYGDTIMRRMYNDNIDFMDYCYKHDKSNAEYLDYISNNHKQQSFFMLPQEGI